MLSHWYIIHLIGYMTLKYIIYIATNTSIGYKLYDII